MEVIMLVLDTQSTEHEVVMKPRMHRKLTIRRSSTLYEVQFVTIALGNNRQHESFTALFIYLFIYFPIALFTCHLSVQP
jgi:hypothetical protein